MIWKPVPTVLAQLLDESLLEPRSLGWKLDQGRWVHRGYRPFAPDDYLIPSATSHRNEKRDNRVVSKAVKRVSDRTGISVGMETGRKERHSTAVALTFARGANRCGPRRSSYCR